MTSIEEARYDLENSVEVFLHCKSLISETLGSIEQTLRFQRQNFGNALKDLNRSHTIWRCRSEDSNIDTSSDRYSTSWLEKVWEEHCVLDDQADEILYAYSMLEKYGYPVPTSVSYDVNITPDGPVSASDVSKKVSFTSNGLVSATKVFGDVTTTSDDPVLASGVSNDLTISSDGSDLASSVPNVVTLASDDGPVLASDVFNVFTVASDCPGISASDVSTVSNIASDGPVLASDVFNVFTVVSDGPVVSASDVSIVSNIASDGHVSAPGVFNEVSATFGCPVFTVEDMVIVTTSDDVDLSTANCTSRLESLVDATGLPAKVTDEATQIINSPCVLKPAALVNLPSIVKPPAVGQALGYWCLLLHILLHSRILKTLTYYEQEFFRTCRGECDRLCLPFRSSIDRFSV